MNAFFDLKCEKILLSSESVIATKASLIPSALAYPTRMLTCEVTYVRNYSRDLKFWLTLDLSVRILVLTDSIILLIFVTANPTALEILEVNFDTP